MTSAEQSALIKRGLRFAVTGLLVTALHAVVAVLFIHYVSPLPPLANGVAFAVATVVSYVINTTWSFSSRLHGRTLLRFMLVSVAGFFLAMLVAWVAQRAGLNYLWGIGAVALTIPAFTFVLHNFWTYR
ncbi:Putative flippase GtrA (transmembrane translocase of bactoprenol-linked glucose) [Pseudomonas sp. ok272]|uniref:GtrA family protein n=1 Tax=unclassified Pseudomonas TaxID=196821 RepID=UPI0008D53A4B|nr:MULTISPECIES: GtrA family protein [unclassified Pseudomonas]SEM39002.1 Putative flippase GtrA (transmembrane translocase of bactoprenol-linked glucose) [Pseudomonas sp. ok272]SFM39902.1 Putative flippase GtrA (transmembrane translocase of bactoprenol-linked glucose) [Pseudomonas sp. ok602]